MRREKFSLVLPALALTMSFPLGALPQTAGEVTLFTPFPGVVVEPGSVASFNLTVGGPEGARGSLEVSGLPTGWSATFRGEGSTIDQVAVGDGSEPQEVRLDVQVPNGTPEGTSEFAVSAGGADFALSVTVKAGADGQVTLVPDFPGLRGPSDGEFEFTVTVRNDTASDVELELEGQGPAGWLVTAEPTGQSKASAISVESGQSSTVRLTAKPPIGAEAGVYDVGMTASGPGVDASLGVKVELVGNVAIELTTPDQRLNADLTKGEPTELALLVVNTGSAPILGVNLTATAPSGWDVTLTPELVEQIGPGESATVSASITTSGDALAGDYDLTFNATAEQASDSLEIRSAVTPSAAWGLVGVGLIALTLSGLGLVFRKFGRR